MSPPRARSMHATAEVTNDDGDKISHGWSQLDIGKHSTNAFVASLEAGDYVSIVTYSDGARVLLDWTVCDDAGKATAMTAIDSMRPERSTNLMAGLTTGFDQMGKLPVPSEARPAVRTRGRRDGPRPTQDAARNTPRPPRAHSPPQTLPEYAVNLIVTTDGMPSSQWSPPRGRLGCAAPFTPFCSHPPFTPSVHTLRSRPPDTTSS